jgi:hypothetical protein
MLVSAIAPALDDSAAQHRSAALTRALGIASICDRVRAITASALFAA